MRRVHEEQERQASAWKEWNQEVREHEKEVSRGMQEEEEHRERIREEWDQEVERHRHECEEMERHENQRQENERQKWQCEVEDHDQIEEEHRKREEKERQKLNMFWGVPTLSSQLFGRYEILWSSRGVALHASTRCSQVAGRFMSCAVYSLVAYVVHVSASILLLCFSRDLSP